MNITFDTLASSKLLKNSGFNDEQAELLVNEFANIYRGVNTDIQDLKYSLIKWIVGLLFAQTAILLAVIQIYLN